MSLLQSEQQVNPLLSTTTLEKYSSFQLDHLYEGLSKYPYFNKNNNALQTDFLVILNHQRHYFMTPYGGPDAMNVGNMNAN